MSRNFNNFLESNHITSFKFNPSMFVFQMYCIYGIGTNNTEYKYTYSTDSAEFEPQIEYGDGDQSVNAQSLRVCQQWKWDGHTV
jgi:hypothetical protein